MRLLLANPNGATISDGSALGSISNSSPQPNSWQVRFGRTVADYVIAIVERRVEDYEHSSQESHLTLRGVQLLARGTHHLQSVDQNGVSPLGVDSWTKSTK